MSCFPGRLRSPHGIFIYLAGVVSRKSQPVGKHSVDIDQSKARKLDELEEQIRDIAAVPFDSFLSKSV
jgi:hypothetical protein